MIWCIVELRARDEAFGAAQSAGLKTIGEEKLVLSTPLAAGIFSLVPARQTA